LERAILLYQQSRYDLAEDELRQELAAEPHDGYAHALLGLCLGHREQFAAATDEVQQAVQLTPDMPFAHYAMACVWVQRNHDKEALAAILEALRLDASQPNYYALLAKIHLNEARWRPALDAAERGLQLDAEDVDCNNLRAIALVKLGRKSEAGQTIDAALRRNPDNAITHANQGWTLLERRQPKEALEHFREALRLDPQNEWARQGIIEALKARNFIYALMLRYFLFMAKFSRRGQWGIVVGAYIAYQILRAVAAHNPALSPWITPILILYGIFVVMTWIASPLFNLLLRLNRFGRMVLSRDQIIASNWIGMVILLALLSLVGCLVYGLNSMWVGIALIFGILILPVAGTFRCPPGSSRHIMYAYTAAIAVCGFLAVLLFSLSDRNHDTNLQDNATTLLMASVIGSFASSWIVNFVISKRRTR
jgi:tetratricopeptide (TPR) repeat protein